MGKCVRIAAFNAGKEQFAVYNGDVLFQAFIKWSVIGGRRSVKMLAIANTFSCA